MPDDILGGTGTEVEAIGQTEATDQSGVSAGSTSAEESFYDATKVPDGLKPSFLEMQKAFTQKTQQFAPYREFEKNYGSLTDVQKFLDPFMTPEGTLNYWVSVGEQLGATREQMAALFDAAGGDPRQAQQMAENAQAGQQAQQNPGYLTVEQFQQWQQGQQQDAQRQAEDQQVTAELGKHNITPASPEYAWVIQAAQRQPQYLGVAERLKRGIAEHQQYLDSYAAKQSQAAAEKQAGAPRGISGSMPGSGSPTPPKTMDEARASAAQRLAGLFGNS